MVKKAIQTGYDKKMNKPIFEELTYDFFVKNLGMEWLFVYKDKTIEIAWHKDFKNIVYELNIKGKDVDAIFYNFHSTEELLENGLIDGKTIKEIWNELIY